ncbi:MAG: class I SAM-dependent methyltransferase [Tissierellia bacterium]|nr:class I SAM-dependent methyltransferase [Tissierellia bacterium]
MIGLSPRLEAIASLVSPVGTLADIGTDHGLLPAFLLEEGQVGQVIVTDISPASLNKSRVLLGRRFEKDQFSCREGDGLGPLEEGEAQALVIAGMGGLLIGDILSQKRGLVQSLDYLILQPMQAQEDLWDWLSQENFELLDRALAREGDRFYPIVKVKSAKKKWDLPISWEDFKDCNHFEALVKRNHGHYLKIEEEIKRRAKTKDQIDEVQRLRKQWEAYL